MSRFYIQLPALVTLLAVLTGSVLTMPASPGSEGKDSELGLIRGLRSLADGRGINIAVVNCTGKADGVAEIACDGYLQCVNEQDVKHVCADNKHLDRDTMSCIDNAAGASGCTDATICLNKNDGSYANMSPNGNPDKKCQTYYTCHDNHFLGHQFCPAALVFDEAAQLCNWAANVPAPCGTKPSP